MARNRVRRAYGNVSLYRGVGFMNIPDTRFPLDKYNAIVLSVFNRTNANVGPEALFAFLKL